MEVIFCVKDAKQRYRVTARGTLDGIADDRDLDEYFHEDLSFTIAAEYADLHPFAEYSPNGILSVTGQGEFYKFMAISGDGNTGRLRILARAEEQGCLPANAP